MTIHNFFPASSKKHDFKAEKQKICDMKNYSLGVVLLALTPILACAPSSIDSQNTQEKQKEAIEDSTNDSICCDSFTAVFVEDYDDLSEAIIDVSWDTLALMDFDYKWVEDLGMEIPYPIFSEQVKKMEGKKIRISGYVIPVSETGGEQIIVLSAYPYTQCFFCGGAGPESVIDVLAEELTNHFSMDDIVTFEGQLRLNATDLNYLNYILEDAVLAK